MPVDTAPRRVLVVDDDRRLLSMLRRGLTLEGFDVVTAAGSREALSVLRDDAPALVVLDVMMPGMDGLELCRRIRRAGDTRILMLTARDAVTDRVAGLEAGADDYLVKPFAFEELVARVRAVLRRPGTEAPEDGAVLFEDVRLDPGRREVVRAGQMLTLTAREFDLLEYFLRHPGQVLTREQIFEGVWGGDYIGESNVIDQHISNVREKLEEFGGRRLIQTVRGAGYSLR